MYPECGFTDMQRVATYAVPGNGPVLFAPHARVRQDDMPSCHRYITWTRKKLFVPWLKSNKTRPVVHRTYQCQDEVVGHGNR